MKRIFIGLSILLISLSLSSCDKELNDFKKDNSFQELCDKNFDGAIAGFKKIFPNFVIVDYEIDDYDDITDVELKSNAQSLKIAYICYINPEKDKTQKNYHYLAIQCINSDYAFNFYHTLKDNGFDYFLLSGTYIYSELNYAYYLMYGEPIRKDNFLYTGEKGDIIYGYSEETNDESIIKLPDDATAIAGGAFYCLNMSEIILNEKLSRINMSAFEQSTLKKIKFNEKLRYISEGAFYGCANLEKVVIPKNVKTIEARVFSYGMIFCEYYSRPSGWDKNFATHNAEVYWKGSWDYDEFGEPYVLPKDDIQKNISLSNKLKEILY